MSQIGQMFEELLSSSKELANVIRGIEDIDNIKHEVMAYLEQHTQHCAHTVAEIRAAFEAMAEENEKLRQSLVDIEAELEIISRTTS
jgi:uncharacterized membrane protein